VDQTPLAFETGDLKMLNVLWSKNPPALRATSFFKGGFATSNIFNKLSVYLCF
jgi:hypothetical protein